jgi:serine protease Do
MAVKLGEMPGNVGQNTTGGATPETALRGISVTPLTPDVANQLKLPSNTKGVVVSGIDPASPAAEAGLQEGDVIQEVNHQPVTGVDGFNRAMQSAGNQPVVLLVDRNGTTSFVVVQPQ